MKRITLLLVITLGCDTASQNSSQPRPNQGQVAPSPAPATTHETVKTVDLQPCALLPDDWFADVTPESGVTFSYRNGREGNLFTLLETVGGGVGLLDYDVDGDLDLFFCGGGEISPPPMSKIRGLPSALYRNDGQWRFTDVTKVAGLHEVGDYTHGVAVADYDRNGYPDLYVTAYGQSRLLKNENGVFHDVTESAGLKFSNWSTAAAWADIDRNGHPDLYVAGYVDWSLDRHRICGDPTGQIRDVCPPQDYPGAPHYLFRNRGDGTFEDITQPAGLRRDDRGLGVVACDLNQDAWIDFYVANDAGDNRLYLGGPTLPLKETGLWAGVATGESGLAEGSMGVDVGDYNGDGLPDVFVTNFELENNALYRSEREGVFTHATLATGLGGACFPFVGFGTGFVDFDLDGWLDLDVCNGNVFYHVGQREYYQPAFLFRNDEGRRFRDSSDRGGPYFSVPHVGRGAAAGDLDNDGAMDLVLVHQNDRVTLLRNQLRPPLWTRVQLEGTHGDREAVGAKVTVSFRGRRLVRWVRSGAGYLSHSDPRVVFPIESDAAVEVSVQWPSGVVEVFPHCEPRQTNKLVEGDGQKSAEGKAE